MKLENYKGDEYIKHVRRYTKLNCVQELNLHMAFFRLIN